MSEGYSSTISDEEIEIAGVLAYACTVPGTVICSLVLVAYGITASSTVARKCLDRVSFRLLVYSLIFNVIFGIAYAATPTSPVPGCDVGAFVVNLTLFLATFFTTCIAINLQLVLVHDLNGQKLEKYYIVGTLILSLALTVPTMALHQFGWSDLSATCWYSNPDNKARLRWIIGTQSFWISLAATIETICSSVVLVWIYHFQRSIKTFAKSGESSEVNDTRHPRAKAARSSLLCDDPRYKRIIFRIALYPIVSLLMNYSTVILDLNSSIVGVNTQLDYRLLVLDLILYGLRTLAYGLLAASDPSFINAVRAMRGVVTKTSTSQQTITNISFEARKIDSLKSQDATESLEARPQFQAESESELSSSKTLFEGRVDQDLEASKREEQEKEDEIQEIARQL